MRVQFFMKRYILVFLLVLLLFGALPVSAASDYPNVYKFYMELGKLALEQGDYEEACANFRHAQAVAPGEKEPTFFINLIKRLQDERVEPRPATKGFRPFKKPREQIIDETLREQEILLMRRERWEFKSAVVTSQEVEREPVAARISEIRAAPSSREKLYPLKTPALEKVQDTVYLDNDLWATQPRTLVRVELRSSVVLGGSNIKRHLIVTPDFITAERIDKDRINLIAQRRGSTLLHVWDDTGRWTLNVEVVLPVRQERQKLMEQRRDDRQADPFKVSYSADWSSFYRGPTYRDIERNNLGFLQRVIVEGETPYGDFDSHVIFNKFDESTEVTGYGVGLTNGKIGSFKNFSIRGFDIQKVFSPLTMPGQYIRGVLFEAEAFNKNLKYTYIHGRDRQIFGFLSPGVQQKRESYVEGGRVTLFPGKENQYSINYARGYGNARELFLKDQVFSVEGQHRIKDVLLSGEFAYDESSRAILASSVYSGDDHNVTVNFRDIEDDFTTVTSFPGRRGEVGGTIFWNWKLGGMDIDTSLDLYRERALPNPEEEDALNVDFSTRIEVPFSTTDRWTTSLYYVDTPGELSPRNNIRTNTAYSKRFELGERDLTAFVGASQQRSRYDLSSASNYDRYSASTGFTFPVMNDLSYYANYEYSWVYEDQSGDHLRPNVFNTGLNYSKTLSEAWSIRSNFSYRNEENTEGTNSFLAGEDNITGSLGATFRPNDDFELFLDGRTRNVWAEEESREAFNEVDVRVGMRTSWEFPFSWNPKGTIAGVVFKDINSNQRQDEGEPGIADISIKVGEQTAVTGANGYYKQVVKAKLVEVAADINSVPDGFIFSTPVAVDVGIIPHKVQTVNFGLTTQSGIYGIVFYDNNGSGKPDFGDKFVAKARIILDGGQSVVSDFEGTYFFDNIQPGGHQIELDVNSLPIEYLPKIKLKNTIETAEGSTYIFHIPLGKTSKE